MAKNKETWALGSSAAFENLKNISERRTDIFGAGDVETGIGMEISNQKRVCDAPVFWVHAISISSRHFDAFSIPISILITRLCLLFYVARRCF
jgi:hypothetical protein